jgi:hypothetical protein
MTPIRSVLLRGCTLIAAIIAAACRGNDATSSTLPQSALDAAFATVPFGKPSCE